MNQDRLVIIESKLAYQEKMIRELNDVLIEQQDELDNLKQVCKRLSEQNQTLSELAGGGIDPANQKPPHY